MSPALRATCGAVNRIPELNPPGTRTALKPEFVLVDFEISAKNVGQPSGRPFKIKIFLGSNQAKIPVEMVQACKPWSDAEYIQIDGNGNASISTFRTTRPSVC